MTLRAEARGKDYRMVEETKQPASNAAWRADMARYLRRGAGDGPGSLAFVNAEESAMLADVLEQGCPGEGFMALPVAADGEPVRPGDIVWLLDEGEQRGVVGVRGKSVIVPSFDGGALGFRIVMPGRVSHKRPESWERIVAELRGGPGPFFLGAACGGSCMGCEGPALNEADCWKLMAGKLADRIEALAGGAL